MSLPIGLLLTNLGTPDAPTSRAVRHYLREFLWDRRVVDLPRALWWPLLHGIILRTRPKKSAALYQKIWRAEGSPLLFTTVKQAAALQSALPPEVRVAIGMRYGTPSIAEALRQFRDSGISRVLVFPLYPQYSRSTTESTRDAVIKALKHHSERAAPPPPKSVFDLRFIDSYHIHPLYLTALERSVRDYWTANGRSEHLLLSFHGIPKSYAEAGDPYPAQCRETAAHLAERLALSPREMTLCFQSRFGRKEWLKPYTDHTLIRYAQSGMKTADVLCPGFSADCLETLEEIAIANRERFIAAGGERLRYIPALNDRPDHIAALLEIAKNHLAGWIESA